MIDIAGICKTYPNGVAANMDISFSIKAGEVHAIVGENGAGKSTLMKILFGIEAPDSGSIHVNGKSVRFASSRDAIASGIGMVFQHFSLVPSLSAAENVVLGNEPRSGIFIDRQAVFDDVETLARRFRLPINARERVARLPVGQQQRVEILKALHRDAKVLILDEPTAVLAPQEAADLFEAIRSLKQQGHTILLIAHKIPEVLAVSDRISVLRRGRFVATVTAKETSEMALAQLMVGRNVNLMVPRATAPIGIAPRIRLDDVSIAADGGRTAVDSVNLALPAATIVGIAAVEGNGQAELLEGLAGMRPIRTGRFVLDGVDLTKADIAQRRTAGVSHIPEDRLSTGSAANLSIAENLVATELTGSVFLSHGLLRREAVIDHARDLIRRFSVKALSPRDRVGSLSGGNMQKVVVARELTARPSFLLVAQPTRGVDLGATEFIWQQIAQARDCGATVLLTSSDLSEVLALSDIVIVFHRGQVVAALRNSADLTAETLGEFMLGSQRQSQETIREVLS